MNKLKIKTTSPKSNPEYSNVFLYLDETPIAVCGYFSNDKHFEFLDVYENGFSLIYDEFVNKETIKPVLVAEYECNSQAVNNAISILKNSDDDYSRTLLAYELLGGEVFHKLFPIEEK